MARTYRTERRALTTGLETPVVPSQSTPATPYYSSEPASEARPPMPDSEVQRIMEQVIREAEDYIDGELSPERALATDYYFTRPFGNEEEGRSTVVLPEVRDAVQGILPQLMRIIFGPEYPVEFIPDRPETSAEAQLATDYVFTILTEENPGFLETLSVLKDGLIKKIGAYKWGWDASESTKAYQYTGLTEEQVAILGNDEGVTITNVVADGIVPSEAGPQITFSVDLTRKERSGRVFVSAVPPEELIHSRNGRSTSDVQFMGHRRHRTRGQLIALGISQQVLDEHGGPSSRLDQSVEDTARNPSGFVTTDIEADEANERILYVEGYAALDVDQDGIAELRKICTVGPNYFVVMNLPTDERPFALFCPDPEPHTLVGSSLADRTMPFQKLKSSIMRATLDSAAASIFSRTAYDENHVSGADIANTAMGAPIRTDGPPNQLIQSFNHQFLGQPMLGVLQYIDETIERTTGQPKGVLALDMDALQSTEKAAAKAAISAAQSQVELYARIFAEGTLKPLMRGILRTLIQHQDSMRLVKIRNEWKQVDPKVWNSNWDVTVHVALGSGMVEQKIATLGMISQKQEAILQQFGPQNPLVSVQQYRNTVVKMTELSGYKDTTQFWNPPQVVDQMLQEAAQQPPPPPSPEQLVAQSQVQKVQSDAQADQAKVELEVSKQTQDKELAEAKLLAETIRAREELQEKMALEREKLAVDARLREQELALKYQVEIGKADLKAFVSGAEIAQMVSEQTNDSLERTSDQAQQLSELVTQDLKAPIVGMMQTMQALQRSNQLMEQALTALAKAASQPPKPSKQRKLRVVRGANNRITGLEESD